MVFWNVPLYFIENTYVPTNAIFCLRQKHSLPNPSKKKTKTNTPKTQTNLVGLICGRPKRQKKESSVSKETYLVALICGHPSSMPYLGCIYACKKMCAVDKKYLLSIIVESRAFFSLEKRKVLITIL